jgi:hypothetical protein
LSFQERLVAALDEWVGRYIGSLDSDHNLLLPVSRGTQIPELVKLFVLKSRNVKRKIFPIGSMPPLVSAFSPTV